MMQEPATQQNSELIQRLLDDQQQKKSSDLDVFAESNQVLITTSRVVNIRYRLYFILLIIVVIVFGNNILLPAWDAIQSIQIDVNALDLKMLDFETKKLKAVTDQALIQKIEAQQSDIILCLNTRTNCTSIDKSLRDNFSFARSYLQLNNLTDPKMLINEKILLTNINEYLIRDQDTKSKNGLINRIAIGEPQQFFGNLYYVPIALNIAFDTKDVLLSFIDNIEKKVLSNPQFRVLYKIDKVNYDIAHYTTKQQVDLSLNAYYYID